MSETSGGASDTLLASEARWVGDRLDVRTKGRIRILHVIQNLNYGGMERLLSDLVRRLDAERFESHVLVLQHLGRFAKDMEGHATLHRAPRQHRLSMLWPRTLAHVIRAIRPDVVHTHSGVWYKGSLAARMAGVRLVVHTDHGRQVPDPWRYRLLDGLASRRTDRVIAVSSVLRDVLAATVVRDPSRIRVVLNGVDTERYRPRPDSGRLRGERGIGPTAPIIGSIGRLEPIKGYGVMIGAFAELRAQIRHDGILPHLVLVGDGSEREPLQRKVASLGLENRVHFLGWRDDIEDLHSSFRLFTMSSWSEGTSISLLEAMSAGVCPIVTDVGGNGAVLGDVLRHRLVPRGNPVALAQAWADAIADDTGRISDARSARLRVESDYSLAAMVRAHDELYHYCSELP